MSLRDDIYPQLQALLQERGYGDLDLTDEKFPPGDWLDWTMCIPGELQELWPVLTQEERCVAVLVAARGFRMSPMFEEDE